MCPYDYGEAPLLLIAAQLKANLIEQGWFELPNPTEWDNSDPLAKGLHEIAQ
jgi:hypothetical protein